MQFLNQSFAVRIVCEAIVRFYNQTNEKKLSNKRWLNFINTIASNGYKVEFEHIKGIDNRLTDNLNREIYSNVLFYFASGRKENAILSN